MAAMAVEKEMAIEMSIKTTEVTVAVNPSSNRYHLVTCHQFDPSHPQMLLVEAEANGARPCRMCCR